MSPSISTQNSNAILGISLKLVSVLFFVSMGALIKLASEGFPIGQIIFFRAFFALIPVAIYLTYIGQLKQAFHTKKPLSHVARSVVGCIAMAFGFYGLSLIPLPDVVTLRYATPLISVVLAAILLKENVGLYRWGAVAVGFIGVLIISWPQLSLFESSSNSKTLIGVGATLISATLTAFVMIFIRELVKTDKPPTVVLYFSLLASTLSLTTLFFGWEPLSFETALLLIGTGIVGGIAQILMTASYRFANVSTIAPFDYTSIIFGVVFGYLIFGDIPHPLMYIGAFIVAAAGLFILYREQKLNVKVKAQSPHQSNHQ